MRKVSIVAFDLDNTLASVGTPIGEKVLASLNRLIRPNVHFSVFSGKPCAYLSGIMRQAGLHNWFIVGENGAVIQQSSFYPPLWSHKFLSKLPEEVAEIKKRIEEHLGNRIWFQPNESSIAAYFLDNEARQILRSILDEALSSKSNINVYTHSDCFDIGMSNISKGKALDFLTNHIGASRKDVIAIGDGENDIPLFMASGYSIYIGKDNTYASTVNVSCIEEALVIVEKRLSESE